MFNKYIKQKSFANDVFLPAVCVANCFPYTLYLVEAASQKDKPIKFKHLLWVGHLCAAYRVRMQLELDHCFRPHIHEHNNFHSF